MVLECGGNGRSAFSPPARGNQWTNGGAGCAEWTGVALADVLKDAKPKSSAKYTSHYSADLHLSGDAGKQPISRGVRHRKGDGAEYADRVGHERPAAAEHSRRAGAPRRSGLGRLGLAEMADAHHD